MKTKVRQYYEGRFIKNSYFLHKMSVSGFVRLTEPKKNAFIKSLGTL